MGFNTAIVVLNDMLHDIEKDAGFGKKVADEVREAYSRRPGYRGWQNSFAVLPSQHADSNQLVVVGGNMIRPLEQLKPDEAERILRDMAFSLGLRVSKAPKPKTTAPLTHP
jgi:hypothetical protein